MTISAFSIILGQWHNNLGMLAALAKLGKGEAISIRKGRQAERILLEEIKKQSRR